MYTFGILAAFFLILSGIIYKKNLKHNQFAVVLIVFVGTFIGSAIVNGILGSKITYSAVVLKEKTLSLQNSYILSVSDTIELEAYIKYRYIQEPDSTVEYNYVDVGGLYDKIHKSSQERISINYLTDNDTIPYFKIVKDKRVTNSKWISSIGLPRRGDRRFEIYIPNDSIHNVLMDNVNEKYIRHE